MLKVHFAVNASRDGRAEKSKRPATRFICNAEAKFDQRKMLLTILRAVRDGSFQSAVEGFSRQWSGSNAPASSSKVGGSRDDRIDALRNTARILRGEKAAFVDRIGELLEDKAAAMKTEAALLRRVAELEQIVQANAETP
ncbi:hypothetical protein AYO21_09133 [Fonsecaea monophora]|uniref:Uncharacterized protein n=1 Tax=Fonsecaea monophora TaxID=254056 RepID=A0A177EXH8_9EURO|nr:hypothetical protein AYO21_09133 [Fonsecaea monophora]OAG36658.1 hypothetical protein AYO21_09133 [Fonsecaea monophora]